MRSGRPWNASRRRFPSSLPEPGRAACYHRHRICHRTSGERNTMPQTPPSTARPGGPAVHSLDHFVFSVPELDDAARFYTTFGLDVRRVDGRLDLYAFGNPHRWASVHRAPGRKKLQYLCFGAYADDLEPLRERVQRLGVARREAHPLAFGPGIW